MPPLTQPPSASNAGDCTTRQKRTCSHARAAEAQLALLNCAAPAQDGEYYPPGATNDQILEIIRKRDAPFTEHERQKFREQTDNLTRNLANRHKLTGNNRVNSEEKGQPL